MMVFRDVKQHLSGATLRSELLAELGWVHSCPTHQLENLLTSILLCAGELECALTDLAEADRSHFNNSASRLTEVTDLISEALLSPECASSHAADAINMVRQLTFPETLRISPPEGFCFYALHPFDYAATLPRISLQPSQPIMVVGIRSMGTTLSAIVLAALHKQFGKEADIERISVRPTGHPYDRVTTLRDSHRQLVGDYNQRSATFLIVDEGPGLSGSSFLSVGDALHDLGVAKDRIVFICSRTSDPDALVAQDAGSRWRTFKSFVAASTRTSPMSNSVPISGGHWRSRVFTQSRYSGMPYRNSDSWPAVWEQLSPAKYLSLDGNTFFKYEGLGRYGAAVRERTNLVAESGFTIRCTIADNGFSAFPWIEGTLLSLDDLSSDLLRHFAEYLAFRSRTFLSDRADRATLEEMSRFNFELVVGRELHQHFELTVERPVIADARMMPYEWMRTDDSKLIKLDCAAHGDNHFLPGSTDIAWDLAGVILEWQLTEDARDYFLDCYERASGDHPRPRLQNYILAYAAFQAGYGMMAASSLGESNGEEKKRLLRDHDRFRQVLTQLEPERQKQPVDLTNRTQISPTPPSPVLLT
jgi:hypothetical protein